MGQSIVDVEHFYKKPSNAYVLTQVDERRFMELFVKRLFEKEDISEKLKEVF